MFRDSRLVVAEVLIMVHVSTECNNAPIVLMLFLLDQGVRQKRQVTRPQSLRVEYTTANSGIVRWSHPTSGAPNSYELIYAAIIISSGTVSGRIAILRLPASPTSRTVTPLDRDDINIFFLTAVYADAVSSALHLRGMFRNVKGSCNLKYV